MERLLILIQRLFPVVLRMSLYASWLTLAVLLLRVVLRKAPKWTHCMLWALVALRLLCPVVPESAVSLAPRLGGNPVREAETISSAVDALLPEIEFETPRDREIKRAAAEAGQNVRVSNSAAPKEYLPLIWAAGMGAMLVYALVSWLRLRRRVRESVRLRENVWLSDQIGTPFILGLFRPKIYLPAAIGENSIAPVLAHEQAHLRRRDHWWKPLGFTLLAVYWFNPVLWLAYVLLCRDIELASDEKAVRELDPEGRKAYAEALLACSAPRFALNACPLAFGETDVKQRIRTVVTYRKPAFWVVLAAVAVCGIAAACFLTNPRAFHPDFSREDILGAEVYCVDTVEESGVWQINGATLDDLYGQLQSLPLSHRPSGYGGLTPLYTITVSVRYHGNLQIRGYRDGGGMTELFYQNRAYLVRDTEFEQFVYRICTRTDTGAEKSGAKDLYSYNEVPPSNALIVRFDPALIGQPEMDALGREYGFEAVRNFGRSDLFSAYFAQPLTVARMNEAIIALCGEQGILDVIPAETTEETPATANTAAPEPMDLDWLEPPVLTLAGREPVTAYAVAFDWTVANGQRNGDSLHPLLLTPGAELPVLRRELYDIYSHSKPAQVFLEFDRKPDEVRVYRWSDEYWQTGKTRAEAVAVYPDHNGFDLAPGGYVYEVVADWKESPEGYGTVCYWFYGVLGASERDGAEELPYGNTLVWVPTEPLEYGIGDAMLRAEVLPDFASMSLEALGAYYLHTDGAGAEGAAYYLYQWFMEYPDSVLIYLERIQGRAVDNPSTPENTAERQIMRAIAAEAKYGGQAKAFETLLRQCRAVYPVGSYAQLIEALYADSQ